MEPKAYRIEQLRCSGFQERGKHFDICRYESFMAEANISHQVHRHDYYMIFAATEGSGRHLIDFQRYDIEAGQIFVMYPGQVHAWEEDDGLCGYLLFFTPAFFTLRYNNNNLLEFPFFNVGNRDPVVKIDRDSWPRILSLFEFTLQEYRGGYDDQHKALRSYLNIILVECGRFFKASFEQCDPRDKKASGIVRNFERLIETHFRDKHKVKEYATLLLLTPNYLNAVCNKILGRPAGALIRERIMLEARRMLLYDGRTVAEIGSTLNFEDNSYFSRFFKKYEGVSPEKFRKSYQESL